MTKFEKIFTVITLFVSTTIVNAEMLHFPQNGMKISPLPVLQWQYLGNPKAFSIYLSKEKAKVNKVQAHAEDLTGDGRIDYQDLSLFAETVSKSGRQYISRSKNGVTNILILNNLQGNAGEEQNCHWQPGLLEVGQIYYWRVDTINDKSVVKGDIRQFEVRHAGVSENISVVLSNPDMGWVLQECYPILAKDASLVLTPDYDYPGVDHIMLTCAWSDIDELLGEYNFTAIDYAYDYWKKRGKRFHLRISTCPWGWWSDKKRALGVPQYVTHVLPQTEKQVQDTYVGKDYTVVDARNAFYQERLSAFLKALAEHFSEDGPRPVDVVDLLGYGIWGEWHTGFKYENLEQRRRALKMIIDTWVEAFGDRWLALSYSHDPAGPKELYKGPITHFDEASTDNYPDYLAYSAFDYALTIPTMTFRRNGCAGTISSNERKFAEDYYKRPNGGLMVSELAGGYMNFRHPSSWNPFISPKVAIDDLLSLHPNYCTIPGWDGYRARNFIMERPDLVDYGLREMGYRYVPVSVRFPQSVNNQTSFTLEFDWINKGVGKAIQNYDLRLFIRKMDDAFVSGHSIGSLNNRIWLKGEQNKSVHKVPVFVSEKGQYKLYIQMIDPRSNEYIKMPLHNEILGEYFIGLLTVQ